MGLSKQDLSYVTQETVGTEQVTKKYVPYVIEPSIGLSRLTLASLADAYDEVQMEAGTRVVMRFPANIAPIKIAILPVVKKLGAEAMELYKLLSEHFTCEYDEA